MEICLPLSCSRGDRPLVEMYLEPVAFFWMMQLGCQCPFVLWLHPQGYIRRGACTSGLILIGWGNWCLLECGMTQEASSGVSVWARPPPEVKREGRDPFPDEAWKLILMSRSGGEKGLRFSAAGKLSVLLSKYSMLGNFWGFIKGVKYCFEFNEWTWDFSWDAAAGKGLISRWRGNLVVFLELCRDSRVTMRSSGSLSCWPGEVQSEFELLGGAGDCSRVTHKLSRLVSRNYVFLSSGKRDPSSSSSAFMSIPIAQFFPPSFPPCCPDICFLSVSLFLICW